MTVKYKHLPKTALTIYAMDVSEQYYWVVNKEEPIIVWVNDDRNGIGNEDDNWCFEDNLTGELYGPISGNTPILYQSKEDAEQLERDTWKAEAVLLIIKQCHYTFDQAVNFAEAALENIDYDIESFSPQDSVDAEIDEMKVNC